jgi:hypothetical protein
LGGAGRGYFFATAPAAQRDAAAAASTCLNVAYRALRDPVQRAQHLLALQGLDAVGEGRGSGGVSPELLEQVMGKAPRSRPQLHDPQGLLSGIAAQPIAAERHQNLGIRRRHHRVAGDVMGHLPRTPRLLAARGEILALQLPQLRLHKRSEIFDQGGGGLGCHG